MGSIFRYLYLSFYNKEFFFNILTTKMNKIMQYLFLLVLISIIPSLFKMYFGLLDFVKDDVTYIISQVPEIEINDGILSMDKESPLIIYSKENVKICLIDTDSDGKEIEEEDYIPLIVYKDRIIIKKLNKEQRVYDLSIIDHFKLNQNKINRWIKYYPFIYVIIIIFMYIGGVVVKLLIALFYSLISFIASKILHLSLSFEQLFCLSIIISTPVVFLNILISIFDFKIPVLWLIRFVIYTIYIFYGLNCYKKVLNIKEQKENTNVAQ